MAELETQLQNMADDFAELAKSHKRAISHHRQASIHAREAERKLREMCAKYGFEVVIGDDK